MRFQGQSVRVAAHCEAHSTMRSLCAMRVSRTGGEARPHHHVQRPGFAGKLPGRAHQQQAAWHAFHACTQPSRASWRRSRSWRQPVSESRLQRVSWLAAASLAALPVLGAARSSRVELASEERQGWSGAPVPAHWSSSCAAASLDRGFPCRQADGRAAWECVWWRWWW